MPSFTFRVGVAAVSLALSTSNVLGNFSPVTLAATATTATTTFLNSIELPLPAGTYHVCVAPVGEDQTNGGYTVGIPTAEQSVTTTTNNPVISLNITQVNLAKISNIASTSILAVLIRQGANDYQISGFAYINPGTDWYYDIISLPLLTKPFFNYASVLAGLSSTSAGSPAAGSNVTITIPSTMGLAIGDTVTIDDGTNREVATITAVSTNVSITVATLVHSYVTPIVYSNNGQVDPLGVLGSRKAFGWSFVTLGPTTGGVTVTREVSSVQFRPDNSANFTAATTRSMTVSFQTLPNDVLDVIRAATGNYVKFTGNGVVIEQAAQSIATAQTKIPGTKPFKLVMPPDNAGYQEVRMYMGCLTQVQTGFSENWTRTDQVPITYNFSTAINDALLVDSFTEIIYKAKGSP